MKSVKQTREIRQKTRNSFYIVVALMFLLTSCQSTYYVVRHAEKVVDNSTAMMASNPPLTPDGTLRAEDLKKALLKKRITKIYSTETLRTKATAKPLSEAIGVEIEIYDAKKQEPFIEQLKDFKGKNTLIVGHSNTLKQMVNGLYEKDILKSDLADNEYDNLFIVKRKSFPIRKQVIIRKTYGKVAH